MKKLLLFVFSFMFLFGFAQTELKSKAQDFNTIKNKGGKLNEITKSSQFSEASHNQLQKNQNVIASQDASDQNEVLPKVSRIYYVKTNGTGSGISWNDAANLSDLLVNLASNPNPDWSTSSPVQIWVAKGYYVPTFTYGGGNTRDRTYLLVRNVQLFGGFNGDETTLDARRPMQNETILNGEKTIAHVLVSAGDVGVALVDGFTIWNGNADYSGDITLNGEGINHRYGGGIYIDNSSPTIKNTLFKDNYTRERGGAVYIENSNSNPVFQNVVFMQNTAGSNGDGGAIYVNDYATLTLSHCTITKNTASDGGAIRYDDDGFATIYNSIIYNNTSTNNPDTLNAELSFNNTKTSYAAFVTRNGNTIKNNFFQYFTEGINNSNTNPSFGSEGFSLNDNSPAINKGDISIFTEYYNAGEKWRDVGGRERWVGSSIDLGAWEKQCKIPVPIADNSTVSLCGISTVGDLIAKINSGTLEVYPNSNTNEKLPTTTALVNNATYYIVKFENKCNSDRVAVKVTINVIPSAPNGATANAFLCQGVNNYFKNITVSQGSNPKWYTSMTGGTALDPNTYEIQNGVKYYVAASNNGCESSRFEASFTVNPRLSAPSGNLNQNFVQGATVSDLVMDQTNIFWYGSLADANSGSNLLPGTQLLVTKKYYAVRHSDTSCNSAATEVNVTVNPLATSEASQQTAEVYPNPVKDVLTIKNEQIITSIDIYDASGKLISQTQHKEKTVSVNMKDLPVGNYIISIYSEGKVMNKKVIKK